MEFIGNFIWNSIGHYVRKISEIIVHITAFSMHTAITKRNGTLHNILSWYLWNTDSIGILSREFCFTSHKFSNNIFFFISLFSKRDCRESCIFSVFLKDTDYFRLYNQIALVDLDKFAALIHNFFILYRFLTSNLCDLNS